jgi:hypothetical protein
MHCSKYPHHSTLCRRRSYQAAGHGAQPVCRRLIPAANATLRRAEERERDATNALATALAQRKTTEAQLAEAKGQS